jgi:hypothetical protein
MGLASFQRARRMMEAAASVDTQQEQEPVAVEAGPDVPVAPAPSDAADWPMSMSPQRYLARHPDGTHADLARRVIANGD